MPSAVECHHPDPATSSLEAMVGSVRYGASLSLSQSCTVHLASTLPNLLATISTRTRSKKLLIM